ncbi:chaperone protein dnaJ C76, chloroplastic [Coffea arabica]|uniref:Chaperone protein dnaJ C76, chloroplastic n=1 Tax=Coffea arabica TaxID=13443 RepID=A0A6P6V6M8_COFAR|nr:chaperone protein dnaJ C76, chloroplastic [Coffea arabica]
MHSANVSLYTFNPSLITRNAIQRKSSIHVWTPRNWKSYYSSNIACKASKCTSYSSVTDLDLYELLGIESSCDQAQIKLAYRALQKRCHPDIAGPSGHDIAIILNEAYAVLSDPSSRMAYDKEQEKFADLRGYTGKPLYSVWLGPENEKRAVFVDEVKCVGCLKCALFAEKTFAVESVYGRARVVAQWADPEDKIQAAIQTCPVDCISTVERSNLAALEFLMSKKPRGKVRIGFGNTVGACASNIFDDLEKFQARYDMTSSKTSKESDIQRDARASAIQAIRTLSNWLYWQAPACGQATVQRYHFTPFGKKSTEPNIEKLRDVAAARKQARETQQHFLGVSSNYTNDAEYWAPSKLVLPESNRNNSDCRVPSSESPSIKEMEQFEQDFSDQKKISESHPLLSSVPIVLATAAAAIVRSQLSEGISGGLKEHIAGSLVRDIVNSNWLQVILAGVTWYLIGMYIVELVEVLQNKLKN